MDFSSKLKRKERKYLVFFAARIISEVLIVIGFLFILYLLIRKML
jgi:hypothetical protein